MSVLGATTKRTVAAACTAAFGCMSLLHAQARRPPIASGKPAVDLVDVVGCVEQQGTGGGTWWLRKATPPKVTTVGFLTTADVDAAKSLPLGDNAFELIGVVDFLDKDALIKDPERAKFVTPQTANATGQLRAGRKVIVKGLLIDPEGKKRINLTQVISLAEVCGS